MVKFKKENLDLFLGVVRKYMQVRGNLSQKDLAEMTGTSVSTLSRLINLKTKDIDPQMIGNIVAKLDIPLHEIIEFVEEGHEQTFKRLVRLYKDDTSADRGEDGGIVYDENLGTVRPSDGVEDALSDSLGGSARRNVDAKVTIGGRERTIPFRGEAQETPLREKIEGLSPRQKAYLMDFLNLDIEGRDVIVDVGTSLFRYFRQKGIEF